MNDQQFGESLEELGRLLAEDVGVDDPVGTFMYAEVGDRWSEPAIFKDVGDRVIFRHGSHDLRFHLMNLWRMADPDKRWSSIRYDILDGRFNAEFGYEELDGEDDETNSIMRCDPFVRSRFGDKPVDYSNTGIDFD